MRLLALVDPSVILDLYNGLYNAFFLDRRHETHLLRRYAEEKDPFRKRFHHFIIANTIIKKSQTLNSSVFTN
jgi:hypothetical protein